MLSEKDLKYIWHPFTQMHTAPPPIPIVRGQGAYLYDDKNKKYIDAISSWWVNLHGHSHPYIAKKIAYQARKLEHVLFAGFTHAPAVHLAERLLPQLPGSFAKIFYSDNGSTAVEVAIKLALQYAKTKPEIICFKHSYHGDTFGAMSAAGKNTYNKPFWSHLFKVSQIPPPLKGQEETSYAKMRQHLSKNKSACFIFEPCVLAAGGMHIYSHTALDYLIGMCKEHQVLTIGDEVMTGFGRTGPLFACERLKNKPDILCLSKGITGGFLPLGVTACTQNIFEAFLGESTEKAFLHGHSYTANPIACTSALASLDLLESPLCKEKRSLITDLHKTFVAHCKDYKSLLRCTHLGTLLVLEYTKPPPVEYFLKQGIIVRPLGNTLYLLPPYCISKEDLNYIYNHILITLKEMS